MKEHMKWLTNTPIAHRGYHSPKDAPENSLLAFKRAVEQGFAIELDIHLLKDQQVVVFHDDHLERMTGYGKKITDCTWEEIRHLKLLNTEENIPLFKDVLAFIAGKVPIMIEIKNRRKVGKLERETYALLNGYKGAFSVQSFNPYSVGWFKEHAPEIIRGQLSGNFSNENLALYKKFLLKNMFLNHVSRPHYINYEIDYLSSLPVRLQNKKDRLILGYTAKNPKEYKEAMEKSDNVVFEGFDPRDINALRPKTENN